MTLFMRFCISSLSRSVFASGRESGFLSNSKVIISFINEDTESGRAVGGSLFMLL
jgi:hypothetical protein